MNKKEFLESGLLEQYMLGLLEDQEDIKKIESFIQNDAEVKSYYDRIQQDMLNLADANSIAPPPSVKKQIMKDVKTLDNNFRPKSGMITSLPWIIAAILVGFLVMSLLRYNNLDDKLVETQSAYAALVDDCQSKETKMNRKAIFFADVNTQKVSIENDGFQMSAFYNKQQSLITIEGLSNGNLPRGKCYYLWGDVDSEMIKIGRLDDPNMAHFAAFDPNMVSLNVTIEDASAVIDHPDVSQLVGSVAI